MTETDDNHSKVVHGAERPLPPNAGKGRVKGVPNKLTKALKEMILGALDDAGGQEWLLKQSEEQPAAFMTLIGKVLPTTLANDTENPLTALPDAELNSRLDRLLVVIEGEKANG